MRVYTTLSLLAGVLLTSCASLDLNQSTVPSASESAQGVVDDGDYRRALSRELGQLAERNDAVQAKTLAEQLQRRHYPIELRRPAERREMTHEEIYERYRDSVLIIGAVFKCGKCPNWHSTGTASGFIISEDGLAVTNYHVMEKGLGEFRGAMTFNGKAYEIEEVLAGDKDADVALIKLKGKGFTPIPVANFSPVGSRVTHIANPVSNFFTVTEGIVSRHYFKYFKNDKKELKKVDRISVTADYAKGSSGGPIFNKYGEVCAIVSTTSSIYAKPNKKGGGQDLQMVIKGCVPIKSLLKLTETVTVTAQSKPIKSKRL